MGDKRVTGRAFHDAGDVDDWRVMFWGAYAYYGTSSFADGTKFVGAISDVAEETKHYPDIDLRPEGVTIRTFTEENGSLSDKDVLLAQRISVIAREHGLEPDPSQLKVVGIAVAQAENVDVRPFWSAAFGYKYLGEEDAIDPNRRNAHLWFHEIEPSRPGRGRVHIDVSVPADQIEARVAAALEAGGRVVNDSHAPRWWTLASPDNHGVDIASWPDTEDFDE